MGSALRKAGITSFLIIEKAAGIGGTWWDNTYPGAECDVRSHLYSYSFDLNPDWSQAYAPQREIQEYLVRFATKFDLFAHIRLSTALTSASFDAHSGLWRLRLENGHQLAARFFVCSAGPLSAPRYPAIRGINEYQGRLFHSARWDHEYRFEGKRVAVIGTAASAVQIVPRLAPVVEKLYVCQRSPNWIIPRLGHTYASWEKALFRIEPVARGHRFLLYLVHELNRLSFNPGNVMARVGRTLAEIHLRRQVAEKNLRDALRPDYPFGCKRVLLSNDYYPALMRSNVELITAPVDRIEQNGIVIRDGSSRMGAIVCATGFDVRHVLTSIRIEGLDGRLLDQTWGGEPDAYRGMSARAFPIFYTSWSQYGARAHVGNSFHRSARELYAAMHPGTRHAGETLSRHKAGSHGAL